MLFNQVHFLKGFSRIYIFIKIYIYVKNPINHYTQNIHLIFSVFAGFTWQVFHAFKYSESCSLFRTRSKGVSFLLFRMVGSAPCFLNEQKNGSHERKREKREKRKRNQVKEEFNSFKLTKGCSSVEWCII